jgi:hypothetical protein
MECRHRRPVQVCRLHRTHDHSVPDGVHRLNYCHQHRPDSLLRKGARTVRSAESKRHIPFAWIRFHSVIRKHVCRLASFQHSRELLQAADEGPIYRFDR